MNEHPTASETVASPSSPPTLPPSSPWIELPGDLTANILQRLGAHEILESAQKVCTTWRKACLDPAMWRVVEIILPDFNRAAMFNRLCRCVVDLSQGQLIDLKICHFSDGELINYIADRSSHLQRLTFAKAPWLSGTDLSEALKKLPQLKELHIINNPEWLPDHAEDIEAIGISCPMMKSFSYNFTPYTYEYGPELCKQYALAIGKTMPNLRHLQLIYCGMKNEALEAILDGCPHLESLDIRGCSGLDLEGALGKRCSQQIRNLKVPSRFDYYECRAEFSKISPHFLNDWGFLCGLDSECYDYY